MIARCEKERRNESVHVRYMLSPVSLSSVTFVRPTQSVKIFGNISTPFGSLGLWLSVDIHGKIYGDRPRGTSLSGVWG